MPSLAARVGAGEQHAARRVAANEELDFSEALKKLNQL
jgi:hypothetical protein